MYHDRASLFLHLDHLDLFELYSTKVCVKIISEDYGDHQANFVLFSAATPFEQTQGCLFITTALDE